MPIQWRIRDLLDLEFFLSGNNPLPDGFDRDVYLAFAETRSAPHSRRELIRYWLDRRRERETAGDRENTLPGAVYAELIVLFRILLAMLALFIGATVTWSLLSYQGQQPVNVFTCLWVLLVPQVLLLLLLLVGSVFRGTRIIRSFFLLYPLMAGLARRLFRRVGGIMANRMTADNRERFRSTVGLLGQARTVYGSVFLWPVFNTAQLTGIFFNLAIIATLLLRVTITDLAFGWQSTLQPGPETVHRIVQSISLPWNWLVAPPLSHPTLDQIAGSKMVLKEGIFRLATRDLVAWWPFLAFSILFYGLIPRLLLAVFGYVRKRRALKTLDFAHAACDRLVQRMQTPRINTESRPYVEKVPPPPRLHPVEPMAADAISGQTPAILIIPQELLAQFDPGETADRIRTCFAMNPVETIPAEIDAVTDGKRVSTALGNLPDGPVRIVILQEAWQPPIKETLSWLRGLREAAGNSVGMVIALVGKPMAGNPFTPPTDTDRTVWERSIQGIGDAYLRVEPLGKGDQTNE